MMSKSRKIIALPDRKEIDEKAAEWVIVLDADEVSDNDRAEFRNWYNESALHRQAFDRFASVWEGLDETRWRLIVDAGRRPHGTNGWKSGVGAAILIATIGVCVWLSRDNSREPDLIVYRTGVGQQKTIELTDGSRINLNTNSLIEVDLEVIRQLSTLAMMSMTIVLTP